VSGGRRDGDLGGARRSAYFTAPVGSITTASPSRDAFVASAPHRQLHRAGLSQHL